MEKNKPSIDAVKGAVLSEFDEKKGSVSLAWSPATLSPDEREIISQFALNMFMIDDTEQIDVSFVSVPTKDIKILLMPLKVPSRHHRGGCRQMTISLIVHEKDDAIVYKYMADFEQLVRKFGDMITGKTPVPYPSLPGDVDDGLLNELVAQRIIEDFFKESIELVDTLCKQEGVGKEEEAFPEPDLGDEITREFSWKVIIVGDPGVGKTSTVLRFTDNAFKRTYLPTLGVNLQSKVLRVGKVKVNLSIWDIAGQSKFTLFRKNFYNQARAVILVYDITNRDSFRSVKAWYEDVCKVVKDAEIFIAANKDDLKDICEVSDEEGKALAEELGAHFFKTSALTGEQVQDMFKLVAEALVKRMVQ